MKKSFLFVSMLLLAVSLSAQPNLMNYQGVARDRSGQVIGNKNIALQIHIIAGEVNEAPVYTEIHKITTSRFGVFNIHIGSGTPIYGHFSDITWALDNHYVKIEMDMKGESNFKDMGTTQLLSVPYAFHAQTAGSVVEGESPTLKSAKPGVKSQTWSMFGNRETNPEKDKLGTTDSTDLVIVSNNKEAMRIRSNGNVWIANKLDIGGNLRVRGDSVIIDHNLYVGDTTNTRSLYVKDDVSDEGDGGFVTTFENENDGEGDGINIRLGKPRANNGLPDPGVSPEITDAQMNNMKDLISNNVSESKKMEILQDLIEDGLKEDYETIGGLAVGVGNMVTGFINDQLGLERTIVPYVELFGGYNKTIAGVGVKIPKLDFGPYTFPRIPEMNLSLIGVDEIPLNDMSFWGIPAIKLTDVENNPLSNHNEFIRFSDVSNQKMGAIRAESVSDWTSNHLTPTYLMGLRKAFTSAVDKKHGKYHFKQEVSQAVDAYKNIGVEYSSGNGDYAEWLARINPKERISAGDIVGVIGGKITKDLSNAEQVMAVSHNPIVLGNVPEEEKLHLGNNIAFMGQIPVKIMGPVSSGDYIVGKGDISGYGIAVSPDEMAVEDLKSAVGRAWDTNPDNGPKMVNTVVGIHNGDYLNIFKQYEKRLKSSEDRLEALESKFEILTGSTVESE
ncbi:MAG: hypothetical protein ACQEQ0_13575 [Bacteroidota bacterium]